MTNTPRTQRERTNTPENLRLITEDVARLAVTAQAKEASRRPAQPEGAR